MRLCGRLGESLIDVCVCCLCATFFPSFFNNALSIWALGTAILTPSHNSDPPGGGGRISHQPSGRESSGTAGGWGSVCVGREGGNKLTAAAAAAAAMIQRSHDRNRTGREAGGQSEVGGRRGEGFGDVTLRCRNLFFIIAA